MRFAVSSLSFMGPTVTKLTELPKEFGIEIFYEWGNPNYWRDSLDLIMKGRTGGFSIHSPFCYNDLAQDSDEKRVFEILREPFDLYRDYGGEFYVIHTNGPLKGKEDPKREEEMRKRTLDRLYRLEKICVSEGIQMVVENLGFNRGQRTLYNQTQFLDIFQQLPQLKCLIDTGHTILTDSDVYEMQKCLTDKIVAYHIHDNDGLLDQHSRIGDGCLDWTKFGQGFHKYTPTATMVFEYNQAEVDDYVEDALTLTRLIEGR